MGTTKMIRGLEHFSYEDRVKEFILCSVDRRRFQGAAFQYLKEAYKKDEEGLFYEGTE